MLTLSVVFCFFVTSKLPHRQMWRSPELRLSRRHFFLMEPREQLTGPDTGCLPAVVQNLDLATGGVCACRTCTGSAPSQSPTKTICFTGWRMFRSSLGISRRTTATWTQRNPGEYFNLVLQPCIKPELSFNFLLFLSFFGSCAVISSIPSEGTQTFNCGGMIGRFVNLKLDTLNPFAALMVCEVEVYGGWSIRTCNPKISLCVSQQKMMWWFLTLDSNHIYHISHSIKSFQSWSSLRPLSARWWWVGTWWWWRRSCAGRTPSSIAETSTGTCWAYAARRSRGRWRRRWKTSPSPSPSMFGLDGAGKKKKKCLNNRVHSFFFFLVEMVNSTFRVLCQDYGTGSQNYELVNHVIEISKMTRQ